MLCMPSIEAYSGNRMVMRNYFLRGAVEMVLAQEIVTSRENAMSLVLLMAVVELFRSLAVAVSAETSRGNNEKSRKAV